MVAHGEKPTLVPALDSHRKCTDAEWEVCDSMAQSFFVALCLC